MAGNDAAAEARASTQKKKKSKPVPTTEEQQEAKKLEVLLDTLHYHCRCERAAASANVVCARMRDNST